MIFGRPFVKRFELCYQTVTSVCLSLSDCNVGVCGQTVGWIKMKLGMQVGLGPGDCVRWAPSSPRKKGVQPPPPNFRPTSIVAKRLDGSKCHLVRRYKPRPRRRVRWGCSSPKKGHSPQFSVDVYGGQMAGWMKTPLRTELDLVQATVLDGDPAPPRKRHSSLPSFRSMSIVGTVAHLSYC